MKLRTHDCGELRASHGGEDVTLSGWVMNLRDHGGVIFVDVRDRYGRTQVVFRPEDDMEVGGGLSSGPRLVARGLRPEDVIQVWGRVEVRPEGARNPEMPTGEIELRASGLEILSRSETPPFEIADSQGVSPEMRMRYRYLDIRNPDVLARFEARHRLSHALRHHLDGQGFLEVETPFLTKSTPEGARDYLVPSRISPGSFYALPQSPQIFKQILMISGVDKYFQIVRCFRDEDLRADRQPEFTQLDLEMSFVTEDDVLAAVEGAVSHAVKEAFGIDAPAPFPRMPYREAMARFGTDRPDTRFGLEIIDVTDVAADSPFQVFRSVAESGGKIRAIVVPGGAEMSRKQIDELVPVATDAGAKGLSWMKLADGNLSGPVAKHFPDAEGEALRDLLEAKDGDLVLMVADTEAVVGAALGALRVEMARRRELIPEKTFHFVWITEFPLFETASDGGITFSHHPFTAPAARDVEKLEKRPLEVRSRAYDLVLNGTELGSGSIRIHDRALQSRIFQLLGLSEDTAKAKFGFLLEALSYGAPPHGGIALGYDRMVAECLELDSIREVIAFPKTTAAACPLTGAPAPVAEAQLRELGLSLEEQ